MNVSKLSQSEYFSSYDLDGTTFFKVNSGYCVLLYGIDSNMVESIQVDNDSNECLVILQSGETFIEDSFSLTVCKNNPIATLNS